MPLLNLLQKSVNEEWEKACMATAVAVRFLLKTNTYGKQKRGGDFRELDFWFLRSQHSETLTKQNKKEEKKKAAAKVRFPLVFVF